MSWTSPRQCSGGQRHRSVPWSGLAVAGGLHLLALRGPQHGLQCARLGSVISSPQGRLREQIFQFLLSWMLNMFILLRSIISNIPVKQFCKRNKAPVCFANITWLSDLWLTVWQLEMLSHLEIFPWASLQLHRVRLCSPGSDHSQTKVGSLWKCWTWRKQIHEIRLLRLPTGALAPLCVGHFLKCLRSYYKSFELLLIRNTQYNIISNVFL